MKLSLNLPVLLSARPPGSKTVRDIHLTSGREFDIREYSRRECVQAYSEKPSETPDTISDTFDLLSIDGKLFRGLGRVDSALELYFTRPFSALAKDHYASLGINIQFEGRLRLQQQLGLRGRKTWPSPTPGGDSRDNTLLEDVVGSFGDIAVAEYGEAALSIGRVASALAVIDGELWCETPPPCIAVCISEWDSGRYSVHRGADFAWDIPRFHYGATCRRFEIDDIEGSEAYMRELVKMTGNSKTTTHNRRALEIVMHEPVSDLNDDYEHPRRIARDLAYACVTAAFRRPELADTLTNDQHLLLERCREVLLAENHLLGERFDVVDGALDLLVIWRQLGRPKPGDVLQLTPAKLLDRYLEETLENTVPVNVLPRAAPLVRRL